MSHHNATALAALVQEELMDALQIGYNATKEGVVNPLLNVVEEVNAEKTQRGNIDWLV